ncbi:MAG: hypothetical protein ACI35W_04145 [Anaeroplasmataceae bacterium]
MRKVIDYIIKNAAIIQIIICVLIFISMYIPFIHLKAGNIDENYNAFLAFTEISDEKTGKVYFKFSFLAFLPFLLLLITIVLNIFLDNKKNIIMHIIKVCLYIIAFVMLLNFKSLMSLSDDFSINLIKFVTYRAGYFIIPILIAIAIIISGIQIYGDIRSSKDGN